MLLRALWQAPRPTRCRHAEAERTLSDPHQPAPGTPAASPAEPGAEPVHSTGAPGAVDLVVAATLAVIALLVRWTFPSDGWFYDDAWQAVAHQAPLRDLPVVGQTQPGFTAVGMAWARLVGDADPWYVVPALVAGVLGPPVLYLWLRRLRFAAPLGALLAAALVVAPIHVRFSGRVKVYTAELLVVVVLAAVLPRLVGRPWRVPIAVGWTVGSLLLAGFSSFSLLAAAAAGAIVVLHPASDLRLRVPAVAAQALGTVAIVTWTQSTYDSAAVAQQWQGNGAMLDGRLATLPVRVAEHLHHVVQTYPGGPRWLTLGCLVLGGAGLAGAAVRGRRTVTARFLVLAPMLAIVGSAVGRIPFGPPSGDLRRVTIWLVPGVAFGLAVAVDALRGRAGPGTARRAFDGLLWMGALAVLATSVDARQPYWGSGARLASETVAAQLRDGEVVWVTRLTAYSFALHADLPADIRADPDGLVGFVADPEDERLLLLGRHLDSAELVASTEGAAQVTIVNAPVGRDSREVMRDLSVTLTMLGFERDDSRTLGTTTVTRWVRSG